MNLHDCSNKSAHLLRYPSWPIDVRLPDGSRPITELFYRESNKWPIIFRLTNDNGRNSRQDWSGCVKKQNSRYGRGQTNCGRFESFKGFRQADDKRKPITALLSQKQTKPADCQSVFGIKSYTDTDDGLSFPETANADTIKGAPRYGTYRKSDNRIISVKMGFVLSDGEKTAKNTFARAQGILRKGITPLTVAVAKSYHLPLRVVRNMNTYIVV
jgi:hypothetical protein